MKRKPFVTFVALFLAVLMAVSVLFGAIASTAGAAESSAAIREKITGLEDDAEKIEKRKKELQTQIAATKDKALTTIEKKTQIDQQMEITRLEIQNLNDQIREYNLLIAETQKKLDDGLEAQRVLNEKYKARIRAMEENGKLSYWSVLFNASSFTDLIDRISIITEIAKADQKMLAQMEASNASVEELRREVEADLARLQEKSAGLSALSGTLEDQRKESEELIKTLEAQKNTLNKTYAEMEKEEEAVRQQIYEAQKRYDEALAEEKRKALEEANKNNATASGDGSATGSTASISIISPLPKGSCWVTDAYGYRIHPIYGYYSMHHGVDLAANLGTPVYAISNGYVTIASYTSANGNYVSLTHGSGYGSIYCHLDSYVVSVGAYVKQGQIIGYVGKTGWATGPHLHFEIHKDGASVNPMNYIKLK